MTCLSILSQFLSGTLVLYTFILPLEMSKVIHNSTLVSLYVCAQPLPNISLLQFIATLEMIESKNTLVIIALATFIGIQMSHSRSNLRGQPSSSSLTRLVFSNLHFVVIYSLNSSPKLAAVTPFSSPRSKLTTDSLPSFRNVSRDCVHYTPALIKLNIHESAVLSFAGNR